MYIKFVRKCIFVGFLATNIAVDTKMFFYANQKCSADLPVVYGHCTFYPYNLHGIKERRPRIAGPRMNTQLVRGLKREGGW